ncbi:nucleoside hydrolase [Crateriforma conspicua]|uniref:nucleoside hydrolase n=1 Tax=Crateriforma conspicua TaxID=2527996 RepID=UPI0011885FDD|nr:nucleoside hydrolase [Crateriforma conspicua]QDV64875.1 Inosine-uridine preferring nucleoside hydrolase [Crateriforma conspicua]
MMPRRFGRTCPLAVLVLIVAFTRNECVVAQSTDHDADLDPVPVIFDTDITGDVDDVLALAMLHTLADRGECDLLAVTISKRHPKAAAFVDAINTFYGRPDIPIGISTTAPPRESRYLSLVDQRQPDGTDRYPHDLRDDSDAREAVELLRQTLADADDHSVCLIQVGLAVNTADLLDSKPDRISPMNGHDLVQQKLRLASIMAGAFGPVGSNPRHLEANVKNHIESMQQLVNRWPQSVPSIWSDFRIGIAAKYPRRSIKNDFRYDPHHPVREAYLRYNGPDHDRPTWDLISVLYAVRPGDGYFGLSDRGVVEVQDDGFTAFRPSADGPDRYLTMSKPQAHRVIEVQRSLVSQPPNRNATSRVTD